MFTLWISNYFIKQVFVIIWSFTTLSTTGSLKMRFLIQVILIPYTLSQKLNLSYLYYLSYIAHKCIVTLFGSIKPFYTNHLSLANNTESSID